MEVKAMLGKAKAKERRRKGRRIQEKAREGKAR
jgi:hypothetical protein